MANAVLLVAPRGGVWVIQFRGEHFGPFMTQAAAIWAAFKLVILYGRNGLRVDMQIEDAPPSAAAEPLAA